ncbi:hypothetical protein Tco_1513122 [Tanacetum coccineum]
MVRIKSLTDEHLAGKISVLHFLMMSHGGIFSCLKNQVTDLNDKVTSSDVAFVKAKAKGREWKKKIKSLPKTLNQFTADATRLTSDLNQAWRGGFQSLVQKFLASDEFSRVQGKLLSVAASASFERGLNVDQTQEQLDTALKKISHFVPRAHGESIMSLVLSSLELPSNDVPSSVVVVV